MCSMENTTMKWENTSMKALSGTLCCYTLTPVVKYNCIMFLLKYKTTHKYLKYFFILSKSAVAYTSQQTQLNVQMICTEQTIGCRPVQSTKKRKKNVK